MLNRPCVIDTNSLPSSQWGRHSFASRVNDVRSRAQSETYRALLAPDDNRLAGLIRRYGTGLVSCACRGLCCGRWSRRRCRLFSRGRAGLCKRQRRNQAADQSNNCFLHSDPSLLISLPPRFGTQGSSGRSWWPFIFTRVVTTLLEPLAICAIERGPEFQ